MLGLVCKNVHAIGDRANAIVLDVFEAAAKEVDLSALRPRIEHAQIMLEADMKRLAKLGGKYDVSMLRIMIPILTTKCSVVIASIQPTHA